MPLKLIGGRDRDQPGPVAAQPPAARATVVGTEPTARAAFTAKSPSARAAAIPGKRGSAVAPDQTIIGPHLTLRGNLRGSDDIVIRGEMYGNIRGRRVEIRRGAKVEGDIVAAETIIAGAVRGNVEAARIEVSRGGGVEGRLENDGSCEIHGEVEGDINSRDVAIRPGAVVNAVVTADRARIAGTLTGVVEASDVVIDDSGRVTGEIDCDGPIEISGQMDGQVRGKRINIREGAKAGEILHAEEITIAGTATGELTAVSVAIAATAHVDGQVIHHQIEIAQGAVVKGSRPWRPKQYMRQRDRSGPGEPDA